MLCPDLYQFISYMYFKRRGTLLCAKHWVVFLLKQTLLKQTNKLKISILVASGAKLGSIDFNRVVTKQK